MTNEAKNTLAETKILTLRKPIKTDSGEITALTLREPTAADMEWSEATSKTSHGNTIAMISRCAGVHHDIIKNLCARDYKEAAAFISSFLEDAPATTEK